MEFFQTNWLHITNSKRIHKTHKITVIKSFARKFTKIRYAYSFSLLKVRSFSSCITIPMDLKMLHQAKMVILSHKNLSKKYLTGEKFALKSPNYLQPKIYVHNLWWEWENYRLGVQRCNYFLLLSVAPEYWIEVIRGRYTSTKLVDIL